MMNISIDKEKQDRILRIAAGNPGAIVALASVHNDFVDRLDDLMDVLEQLGITGSNVWLIYKKCGQDASVFVEYPFSSKDVL
jgi:hypothetical protein